MPRTFSFATATASSPTTSEPAPTSESLISRIVFAPLLFVSFLVSLIIVDREASSSVFGTSPPGSKDGKRTLDAGKEKRYYHSHQKKLARREIGDAFNIRNKVLVSLCVGMGVTAACMAWFVTRVWEGWGKEQMLSAFRTITSKIR